MFFFFPKNEGVIPLPQLWDIIDQLTLCKWGVGVISLSMMYEVTYLCVGYDPLTDNDIGLFHDI